MRRAVLLAALVLGGLPTAAGATPPTLTSVSQTSGHITATWTLAPGTEARVIEAATDPATGSDGYFFSENVKRFSTLETTQTSYTATYANDPGTYYVHVASYDPNCTSCPVREWSNVMTVTIPAPPPPPSSAPAPTTPTSPTASPTPMTPQPQETCNVPRVAGLRETAARVKLARAGCRTRVVRARSRQVKRGRVISSSPRLGRQTTGIVVLFVSRGR